MAAPYTSQAIANYNTSPPADDGSQVSSNRVTWAGTKTKLADPIKTLSEAINSQLLLAFAKLPGGAGVTSTAVDYTVQSTDQGKLVRASASSITITTPDASTVTSPFLFMVLNNSDGSITLDGNGAQTIDGNLTITLPAGAGAVVLTDGSNWFTNGIQGTLVGKQLGYGDIINGTLTESNGSNAVTFSLKTLAGNDPSASDPVLLCFRNATAGNGNYVYRTVTAALSFTISSGSTLGASNNTAFKVWIVLFDDAGTIRMGAINTVSGTSIYPLGRVPLASSTAEGGAGAADSAQVFYTGTAVTSKPYLLLAHCDYESGLATAGSWNVSPTNIELFGPGVPLPGTPIQNQGNETGAVATGTTTIPEDDTIPQNTEGDQYMSQAITPTSATNILVIEAQASLYNNNGAVCIMALFQDSTANALAAVEENGASAGRQLMLQLRKTILAGTTSSTTFKIRGGSSTAGTTTFNGVGGTREFGGVMGSYISIREIMT